MIRLIASDIDGTLFTPQGTITPRTVSAIRRAQAKGAVFAMCTGRFPENALMIAQKYGLRCPVIGLNGAQIHDGSRVLHRAYLPLDLSKAIRDALERCGAVYYMFCEGFVAMRRAGHLHHSQREFGDAITRQFGVRYESGEQAVYDAPVDKVFKYFVYEDDESCPLSVAEVPLRALPALDITRSSAVNFEVMYEGVSKASGLAAFAKALGVPREAIMALGDYDNDSDMLRYAGLGVAMGNAVADAKAAADAVTLDNAHDGVAAAIERYVLGEG